jgi:nucleoside-diphosphate-sugar epimerase
MRIIMTGTDGYIGSVMADVLIGSGHEVTALDTGFYRAGWLFDGVRAIPPTTTLDVRDVTVHDLAGADAVVHLAELSNDPLGALAPEVTFEINHRASVELARLAREAGVPRFVHMSSCSVYGVGSTAPVDETSPVNPQTAYAECKVLVERDVRALATDDFHPTFLRNATAFGASPRMRFDIVLNNLMGVAWTTGEIRMTSDGTPWRPIVHIRDITRAVEAVLAAPEQAIHAETFNVGSDAQNYRVREIAEIVSAAVPGCSTTFGPSGGDNRSYRVRFDKIHETLPDFACAWDAEAGAAELASVFGRIDLDAATFAYRGFTRLEQLRYLLSTGQVDDRLRWTSRGSATADAGDLEDAARRRAS